MDRIPTEPSLLQTEKSVCSQPLFVWELLWALNHLCGPLLELLQYAHVALTLGSPALGDNSPGACQQCRVERKDHISQPFCNVFSNAAGEAVGHFATRAYCWIMFHLVSIRMPRSFSAELLSSWSGPSLSWCMGLFLPRLRIWHFRLLCKVLVRPLLQLVSIPLNGSTRIWSVSLSFQFCIICNLHKCAQITLVHLSWYFQHVSRSNLSARRFDVHRY